MDNICPYCKAFDFYMTDFRVVHRHLAECLKRYINNLISEKVERLELEGTILHNRFVTQYNKGEKR